MVEAGEICTVSLSADILPQIREWDRDTYVYFDNTMHGAAPVNALSLMARSTSATRR